MSAGPSGRAGSVDADRQQLAEGPAVTPTQAPETRPWALVAQREVMVRLTDRNFLVGTAVTVVLLVGLLLVQGWLSGRPDTTTVAVTDAQGADVVAAAEEHLADPRRDVTLEALSVADRAAGEAVLAEEEAEALLVPSAEGWVLVTEHTPSTSLRQAIAAAASEHALSGNAAAAGTTVEQLRAGGELAVETLSDGEDDGMVIAVAGVAFAFLFYLSSVMFGMTIASSVVEEKQSRIVEILAAAIPVRALLAGKIIGTSALALAQLVLLVAVGLVGSTVVGYDVFLPGMAEALAWYLPFFLAGFLALACIWAAAGAMASRNEDLQTTTTPLTMALVAVFLLGFYLEGTARAVASFVPVLSTLLMPLRVLEGDVGWWEPALALVLTLAFAVATVLAGARLYRRSLLHTQGRLGWRAAWSRSG
ncbi:ABC transporter permease [Ornithinicoccus halotolerans]|uniref:ABC transporter permease n=1 Tax=Ornithinicoccus halotolerans TaxID=1748220 RepID=UPI001294935F|nr:ABC transporter permease [Ornithinicoccus halotolerans]